MKAEVLTAIPAAGKTKAILENIKKNNEKAIVASISRQLSKESFEYFNRLGGRGVIIDTDNKHGMQSVNTAIMDSAMNVDVIFVTHKALLSFTEFEMLKGFCLYIDEVPELVSFDKFSFTQNLDHILDMCEPVSGELDVFDDLVLKPEFEEKVQEMAIEGRAGRDEICSTLLPLYASLLRGIPTKLHMTKNGAHCYFINDLSTQAWEVFDKVVIACANLEDTFTGKVLKHFNGWEFVESPLNDKLLFKEYANSSRIKINVMMEQSWSKHSANQEKEGMSNYNRMKSIIEGLVDDQPFIYTRNSYRARFTKGLEVPYNPHGLNSFMRYNNVAVMFSFNPLPWQIPLLRELALGAGLEEETLVDAFIVSKYLEPAFQLCARSNIRVAKSNTEVNLYVPDMRLAEYMKARYFKNATISTQYMIPAKEKKTTRNRNSFQQMFNMDKKEKYKYMYLLRKVGRKLDPSVEEDVSLVREWITKTRAKLIK